MYSITAVNEITNKVRRKSNVLYRVIFPVQKVAGTGGGKGFSASTAKEEGSRKDFGNLHFKSKM